MQVTIQIVNHGWYGFGTKYEQGEQVSTFGFRGEASSVPCDVQRNWTLMGCT